MWQLRGLLHREMGDRKVLWDPALGVLGTAVMSGKPEGTRSSGGGWSFPALQGDLGAAMEGEKGPQGGESRV
jgi:hypothetical protein